MIDFLMQEQYAYFAWGLVFGLVAWRILNRLTTWFIVDLISEWFQEKIGWSKLLLAKVSGGIFLFFWTCICLMAILNDSHLFRVAFYVSSCYIGIICLAIALNIFVNHQSRVARAYFVFAKSFLWATLFVDDFMGIKRGEPVIMVILMSIVVIWQIITVFLVAPVRKKEEIVLPYRHPGFA